MKKFIAGLLALMLILSLAGCGTTGNLKEKTGEALTDNITGKTSEGSVDINGDNVKIKGKNGEEVTVGTTGWPKSELAKSIPEFKSGKITGVLDSADSVMVTMESVQKADVAAYLETIKKDFTQEPVEATAENSISYGAKNAADVGVTLQYSEGTLTITITKAAQ